MENENSTKHHKTEVAKMMGRMYLVEGKTAHQISDETGYSLYTVKRYLSQNGYFKKEREEIIQFAKEVTNEKPYVNLDKTHVMYEGKIYEKLSRKKLAKMLFQDQEKKKKGK